MENFSFYHKKFFQSAFWPTWFWINQSLTFYWCWRNRIWPQKSFYFVSLIHFFVYHTQNLFELWNIIVINSLILHISKNVVNFTVLLKSMCKCIPLRKMAYVQTLCNSQYYVTLDRAQRCITLSKLLFCDSNNTLLNYIFVHFMNIKIRVCICERFGTRKCLMNYSIQKYE